MSRAGESSVIRDQEFATPDLPVKPVTRTVECDSDDFSPQVVLGHTTGNVGVVMLNWDLAIQGHLQSKS